MILMDTHVWLWWVGDQPKLPLPLRRRLQKASALVVSAISCWEVGMLVEGGRLKFHVPAKIAIEQACSAHNIHVHPVSDSIATRAGLLGSSFHGDPADRLIVATALELDIPIATKDERIRAWRKVETIW